MILQLHDRYSSSDRQKIMTVMSLVTVLKSEPRYNNRGAFKIYV